MTDMLNEFKTLLKTNEKNLKIKWKKNLNCSEIIEIEEIKANSNLKRIVFFVMLIILIQISNILVDYLTNAHPRFAAGYLNNCLLMITICIIYFFICLYSLAKHKSIKNIRKKKLIYLSFWIVFSSATMFFCVLDLLERDSLNNFIVLVASIAIVPVLDTIELIGLSTYILFFQSLILIQTNKPVFLIQQSIGISISSALIANILFYSYINYNIVQRRLKTCAETDALTGLLNRRGLESWISKNKTLCVKEKCFIALAIIDIDNFKDYNDNFGHLNGDNCLKAIACCLSNFFRNRQAIVSRFGGEEFLVIIKNTLENEVINSFTEIKYKIENYFYNQKNNFLKERITVSIGVTFEEINENTEFDDLFRKADSSLYMAKKGGKNLIIVEK